MDSGPASVAGVAANHDVLISADVLTSYPALAPILGDIRQRSAFEELDSEAKAAKRAYVRLGVVSVGLAFASLEYQAFALAFQANGRGTSRWLSLLTEVVHPRTRLDHQAHTATQQHAGRRSHAAVAVFRRLTRLSQGAGMPRSRLRARCCANRAHDADARLRLRRCESWLGLRRDHARTQLPSEDGDVNRGYPRAVWGQGRMFDSSSASTRPVPEGDSRCCANSSSVSGLLPVADTRD